jgi:hypothetical protein
MLLPRPFGPPNERRMLTFRLEENPGDRHERRMLTFRLEENPGDRQSSSQPPMSRMGGRALVELTFSSAAAANIIATRIRCASLMAPTAIEPETRSR